MKFKSLFVLALTLIFASSAGAQAFGQKSGPGKVRIGVDASEWSSDTVAGPGIVPIGGSGQLNGEFVTVEKNGIQIGIRAQERFFGPYEALADGKVGVYLADTGFSSPGRATWNYDFHIDLRDAQGVAKGTTLADYNLYLETDIVPENETLFGFGLPLDLTFGGFIPGDTVLYQNSLNPTFGNVIFDPTVPGIYTFNLVLEPATFNGPAIVAAMEVEVE